MSVEIVDGNLVVTPYEHGPLREVVIDVTFRMIREVPVDTAPDEVPDCFVEGRYCADNFVVELGNMDECACDICTVRFVRWADD